MKLGTLMFPLLVGGVVAALFVVALDSGSLFSAFVTLIVGAGILTTIYMAKDVETDERDVWNACRAALATLKTMTTLGVLIGAWLAVKNDPVGTALFLFSLLSIVVWFLLYVWYSWRDTT